jgi:hypothetical protein
METTRLDDDQTPSRSLALTLVARPRTASLSLSGTATGSGTIYYCTSTTTCIVHDLLVHHQLEGPAWKARRRS